MLRAIIHNDDIGLTYGFSEAIFDCYTFGITTSTSIRTNGTAYKYTIKNLLPRMKNMGLGLHINLTDGPAYNKNLGDNQGNYKRNYLGYLSEVYWNKNLLNEIYEDMKKQFEIAIERDKLKIDHVNGHDHVHMIPPIFEMTAEFCSKYKIKYLRIVNEDYYVTKNLAKDSEPLYNSNILKYLLLKSFVNQNHKTLTRYKLKTTDRFFGLIHTGNMDLLALRGALEKALKQKYSLVEILSHPVYRSNKDIKYTSQFIKNYANKKERLIESEALKNPALKQFIADNKIKLTSFKQIL